MADRLTYADAERVAEAIAPRWHLLTGQTTPPLETLTDLVQAVMRHAGAVIGERVDG